MNGPKIAARISNKNKTAHLISSLHVHVIQVDVHSSTGPTMPKAIFIQVKELSAKILEGILSIDINVSISLRTCL
jgi:hypothetical protein